MNSFALGTIIAVILGGILGYTANNTIKQAKMEAYMEACITHGGDPIKCQTDGQNYVNK
jgi:hypothetical protein